MVLLTQDAVGAAAFGRLIRTRVALPYGPGVARPRDMADTRGLRAHAACVHVRQNHAVTGLGALWIHGFIAAPPETWHVLAGPGSRDKGSGPVRCHAARAEGSRHGPVLVVPPERACVDALRWEEPARAIAGMIALLSSSHHAEAAVRDQVERMAAGPGRTRIRNLVETVSQCVR